MKDKGVDNENHEGKQPGFQQRYKIIPVKGADLLYDTLTNTYYKQFRLPFKEDGNG